MFLGEIFCLAVYKVIKAVKKEDSAIKVPVSVFRFAVPALFDVLGSSLCLVGLTMCAGSIYQMLRASLIVMTATLAYLFLGRKQFFHHFVGLILILSALTIVIFTGILNKSEDSEIIETKPLGIIVVILGQLCIALKLVAQENLVQGQDVDPLIQVGIEGVWGLIIYVTIVFPIVTNMTCDPDSHICTETGYREDLQQAFTEYRETPRLLFLSCCLIFSVSGYNATATSMVKYASAAQAVTVG